MGNRLRAMGEIARRGAGVVAFGMVAMLGCAGASATGHPAAPVPSSQCPEAVPSDEPARHGTVFIDGRRVGVDLPVRRTNSFPETYDLTGPEPAELAALPVERIDMVQYARGVDAEQTYAICRGTVAILFTTRRSD